MHSSRRGSSSLAQACRRVHAGTQMWAPAHSRQATHTHTPTLLIDHEHLAGNKGSLLLPPLCTRAGLGPPGEGGYLSAASILFTLAASILFTLAASFLFTLAPSLLFALAASLMFTLAASFLFTLAAGAPVFACPHPLPSASRAGTCALQHDGTRPGSRRQFSASLQAGVHTGVRVSLTCSTLPWRTHLQHPGPPAWRLGQRCPCAAWLRSLGLRRLPAPWVWRTPCQGRTRGSQGRWLPGSGSGS